MRLAITADVHLGHYWKTNPRRAMKIIDIFSKTLEDMKKNSDKIIIVGDLYHSANLPPDCLAYIDDHVDFYSGCNMDIVVGNHETFLDVDDHQKSLPRLLLSRVSSIYESGFNKMAEPDGITTSMYALPFQPNMEAVISYLSTSSIDKDSIIFGHLTPTEVFERSKISITPIVDALKPKFIFLGDYHTPLNKHLGDTTLYSIGSTYYWDISDIGSEQQKRYLILDTDTMKVESVPIELPKISKVLIDDENALANIFKDKDTIYYIASKLPLDLTSYINNGYDIYFDYLTPDNKYSSLVDGVSLESSSFVNVDDSWESYIKVQQVDSSIKDMANNIFKNRNSLTSESIINILGCENQ